MGLGASFGQSTSQTPASLADLEAIQARVKKVLPQAKKVTIALMGEGAGSGVIISPDGLALTAGHVSGKPGTKLKAVLHDGTVVKAHTLGSIRIADAGVIRLESGRVYPFTQAIGEESGLGAWCLALGHPGGLDEERGTVARIGRVIARNRHTLRTDCKLIGGDSGGPLFDLQGRLIGIHSRISRAPDQNFHVPLRSFSHFWDRLADAREASSPMLLGVKLRKHRGGLIVTEVLPKSPAARAAIKRGDLITHIQDLPVLSHQDLKKSLRMFRRDRPLLIAIRRGQKHVRKSLSLPAPSS